MSERERGSWASSTSAPNGVARPDVTVLGELWVRACSSRERANRNWPGERDVFVAGDDSVKNGSEFGALPVARCDDVLEGQESEDRPG